MISDLDRSNFLTQYKTKLKLEQKMANNITILIRRIGKKGKTLFADGGGLIDPVEYAPQLAPILLTGFLTVRDWFFKNENDNIQKKGGDKLDSEKQDELLALIYAFCLRRSQTSATYILTTLSKKLLTISNFFENENKKKQESNLKLSKKIYNQWVTDSNNHVRNIATPIDAGAVSTETQGQVVDAYTSSGYDIRATWVTRMDDRVRFAHSQAEGQTVTLPDPFIVGGEELSRPRDPAGSDWNIMGCRCEAIVTKVRETQNGT